MANSAVLRQALIWGAFFGVTACTSAQSVSEYAVLVGTQIQTNPPQIQLFWPLDGTAKGYTVYRKLRDDTAWGAGISLAANATNYIDSNVVLGGAYEYDVNKSLPSPVYSADGYIYAGINAPCVTARGSVILIVDNTMSSTLAMELTRLQQDFVGDGWTVLRHDVPRAVVDPANTSPTVWAARSNELASVKALITSDYQADPADVKAVFLFGHVPVPYSGNIAPDQHLSHEGAWPADAYYGDMAGIWTDSSVNDTTASDPRNWNVPGDGKFDQSDFPANITLQVGRVDLSDLPSLPQNETELLRQYLNKDHNFRFKLITAQRRGLIDDNFGVSGGEAFAADGWQNFSPFFGATNIASGGWLGTLSTGSYLWGYGCGAGTYTSAAGVASTANFATNDTEVVFTMLFGSYFGDWDSQDNFMRAQLGTTTYSLTSVWAGRPWWEFHHMALGETIGFSTLVTQNNNGLYSGNPTGIGSYSVSIALMGDPTLRMHTVAPPSALTLTTGDSGAIVLNWSPSPDPVAGYLVFGASDAAGPFTQLTVGLITETNYSDATSDSEVYMVRAVNLENSASGSYYNPSQGIFQSLSLTQPVLLVTWTNPAPITYGAVLTTNQLNAMANVPGSFSYSPPNGAALNAGTNALSVIFTPTDLVDYSSVTDTVSLVVLPAPLTVTAANASRIYGPTNQPFTGTIMGLTNGDDITATYSCSATSSSPVGNYPIIPSLLDPGDRLVNYSVVTNDGTLTITMAFPMLTWTNPAPIAYGAVLTTNQLNATANVPGGFAYNPPNGTALNAGTNALSVIFTPTDLVDYSSVTDTVSLVVLPAPIVLDIQMTDNLIVLSWNDPASVFVLQAASGATGVFTNVPGAGSPYTNAITGAQQFFRLMAP